MLNLKLLKVSLLLLLVAHVHGQEWHKVDSLELNDIPTAYASDFQGNLYFGFSDGRLTKYDFSGELLENFSLSNNSSISLIDVQNNLKPFLFYFDNQQITILDRFSSVPKDYPIADLGLDIAMLACPSPDGNFWIIENNPQRLRKVDPIRELTILDVQVVLGDSVKMIQAYQNILLLANEKGLLIFDQFGGLLSKIESKKIKNVQLIQDSIYAYTNEYILKINPFNGKIESTTRRPKQIGFILKTKNQFVIINDKIVTIYKVL